MNETSKPYENIFKELNEIIDKINKNFDFKTFEKQKLSTLEEVIKKYVIIFC